MNIVGNINGSYKAPQINLFEIANERDAVQQSVKKALDKSDTQTALKVNISKEGLRALHGNKLTGSGDEKSQVSQIEYISEHQPIESFTNQLSRELQESYIGVAYENRPSVEEMGNTVLNTFRKIADEIITGYKEGSRVRFVEDSGSTDGFRRLTMEDELAILQDDFEKFVQNRFGQGYQEQAIKNINIVNDIQKTKARLGIGDGKVYEPVEIPDTFADNLIKQSLK